MLPASGTGKGSATAGTSCSIVDGYTAGSANGGIETRSALTAAPVLMFGAAASKDTDASASLCITRGKPAVTPAEMVA